MRSSFYLAFLFFIACTQNKKEQVHKESMVEKYTCSMHPEIVRDAPGACPICGMDLIRVDHGGNGEIVLSDQQMKLANIATAKVSLQPIGESVVVNGKLTVDEEKITVASSRVEGRIEKLFFKEPGITVKKGEPLYQLYSEQLITLQKEYLLTEEQSKVINTERYKSYVIAAEKKLLRYGLTNTQINQLHDLNSVSAHVTFYSPANGIITEINSNEGQYVKEGDELYKIEDLHTLWFEADLYPKESSLIDPGNEIEVSVGGFESHIKTKVTFMSPSYQSGTQIRSIRGTINNSQLQFKPGMAAIVMLQHSSQKVLAVPADAVIHDATSAYVYVLTNENTFQQRRVTTGIENANFTEIIDGLKEDEVIATTGVYLLHSDFELKDFQ
jgi:Cu(I)/Ag(I) efflux system membrane fusion protein